MPAYRGEAGIFAEIASVAPILAGISHERLEAEGIQWPCPAKDHPGTEYLYKEGFPKGKVPFLPIAFNPPAEGVCGEYPFVLTTGRNLFQYHSGTMTRRVAPIEKHAGEAYVEVHPADGRKLGIGDGEMVTVSSRRGTVEIKARFSKRGSEGTVFIPMHYREAAANVLTNDALDPDVLIPEFKVCAVVIERVAKAVPH